jgi:hypothetical protein
MSRTLMQSRDSLSAKDLVFKILLPLVNEVKARFRRNELQVAMVQALYSLIRFHASSAINPASRESLSRKKYFIASLEGSDKFNPILAALLCGENKLSFFFSHISLPVDAMVETASALKSHVIIIHFDENIPLPQVESIIAQIPPTFEVLLGYPGPLDLARKNVSVYQTISELSSLLEKAA